MPMIWSPWQRIGFRFLFLYLVLFCLSVQFPTAYVLGPLWEWIMPWFGEQLLGLSLPAEQVPTGSGDGLQSYLGLIGFAALAAGGTLLWTALDRRRSAYPTLLVALTTLLRYYLAYQMLIYGLAKVLAMQFPAPGLSRLVQTYGDSSPMGLLWTFMGYSKAYSIFTGLGEVAGGLFLLFRRTTTLGALIVFAVMINVMMLNYCYDVPVKILSTHIVAMAAFLIALDARRLLRLFLLNRSTQPRPQPGLITHPGWQRWLRIGKGVALVLGLGAAIYFGSFWQRQQADARRAPLYGLYEVEAMRCNAEERPPLLTDSTRWRRFIVEGKGRASVQFCTDRQNSYQLSVDTTGHQLELRAWGEEEALGRFRYERPAPEALSLRGRFRGDSLELQLRRRDERDFLLVNRGFHWVNERPYNE